MPEILSHNGRLAKLPAWRTGIHTNTAGHYAFRDRFLRTAAERLKLTYPIDATYAAVRSPKHPKPAGAAAPPSSSTPQQPAQPH